MLGLDGADNDAEERATTAKLSQSKKNRKGEIISVCPLEKQRKEQWIQHLLKNCTKDQYINYLLGEISLD